MQQNQLHRDFVNRTAKERYSIMYGSKASGKTIERLINYFILAKCIPNAKIQVIAESMPVIKSGCLADFRYMFAPYFKRYRVKENATDKMFFFPNNSTLQFMQVDDKDKANQLGRATFRFINEANNIDKETFDLLDIRTERQISLDYNPTSKFWVDEISTEKNTGKFNW
ncbi:MAG: phage terminase large subunit, partial [Bacteroidales bacterium]|nr:phage terminase large subunit [Bacteroidales bacterium]